MTMSPHCTYGTDRERAIVDYLYGEGDPGERSLFETHLTQCPECRAEVGSGRVVRQALAGWAPPEPMRALDPAPVGAGPRLATATPAPVVAAAVPAALPGWAKVAAAVLCVGVGLGAANLRIVYSAEGLTVQTGWMTPAAPAAADGVVTTAVSPADLTALEQSLRADMAAVRTAAVSHAPPASDDDAVLRQVRALIARSEQRQQSELALRIGDLLNDVQTQRRADLSRIERTIGVVQSNTGMEVMRQREMINTLAVRVSSQR